VHHIHFALDDPSAKTYLNHPEQSEHGAPCTNLTLLWAILLRLQQVKQKQTLVAADAAA
jgi:hypothetical protein